MISLSFDPAMSLAMSDRESLARLLICNFTGASSNCSNFFTGVDLFAPILQACLSALIIAVSVPCNLILIAAIIVHRNMLDNSYLLIVSFLVSNTIVSVFLSGEVFVTTAARAWVFGYWGCQVVAFITIIGIFSRWVGVGLVAFDRFFRVFFTNSYRRFESRFVFAILLKTWATGFLACIPLFFSKATGFNIAFPGCSYLFDNPDMNSIETAFQRGTFVYCGVWGTILPPFLYLYIFIYFKERRDFRRIAPNTQRHSPDEVQIQRKTRRATLTYFLLYFPFNLANIFIIGNYIHRLFIQRTSATPTVVFGTTIILSTFAQCYVFQDIAVLLTNRDIRNALWELFHRVIHLKWWKIKEQDELAHQADQERGEDSNFMNGEVPNHGNADGSMHEDETANHENRDTTRHEDETLNNENNGDSSRHGDEVSNHENGDASNHENEERSTYEIPEFPGREIIKPSNTAVSQTPRSSHDSQGDIQVVSVTSI